MKIVFISSDVSQSDVLVDSFLDGINYKITNQISLQDIPEDATHVTFIYHENYRFPFTIKERYDLFKQLHDASFNMLSDEEIADLSHVQVFDSSEDIVDSYFVDKQNNRIQPHQFYSYVTDFPFFHYEYIESASLYSELDSYNCDISSDYFNDMMYFFNELQKRNKHIVIDLLTCNFIASKIQDIESHFPNLVMRVSTNDTGNPEYGGDWIMEYTSDETETAYVKDIYFNEHISHFSIVLDYIYEISQRTNETDYYYDPLDTNNGYEIKFRVRKSDGYLSRVWSLRGSYLNQSRSVTTIFIPSAVKLMTYYSRFSDYGNTSAVETTGIEILKFHDRNNTDLTIQASTFREHPSIEEIHIDQPNIILDSGSIFRNMTKLNKLVLTGGSITSLPDYTASYCDELLTVQLGSTITTIGERAFYSDNCLNTINLDNVEEIGIRSFQYCDDLNNIVLSNVTTIGSLAFYNCYSLTSINLSSATLIEASAFQNCTSLTSITLPSSGSSVTIKLHAFRNTGITSIDIPNGIEFSDSGLDGQFSNCINLTSFTYGNQYENVYISMFDGCTSLSNVDLSGTNVKIIKGQAFNNCGNISNIYMPSTLERLEDSALANNSIHTFVFPPTFNHTVSMTSLGQSSGDKGIWNNAFSNTTITNLYYNASFGTISSGSSFNGGTVVNAIGIISLSGTNISHTIDLTTILSNTIFTIIREDSSNYLIKVTTSTSITISYTTSSGNQSIITTNNNSKYFDSDISITLPSGETDTVVVEYFPKYNGLISNTAGLYDDIGDVNDFLEAYNITASEIKILNTVNQVTFIDSSISNINFNNKFITGLRFSGSFTIPNCTYVSSDTLNSLYHKYSIVNNKLYDKLYFTLQDVSVNRDFSDNYGSEHSFDITSKKYYINGLETPQLRLIAGISYECSFPDSSFGIFEDIYNTSDPNGFNANIFGGTGSSISSYFTINSSYIDVSINASGNYYYGHSTTHGVGGLNNNITIITNINNKSLNSTISEHSNIITCYKVRTYSDIFHHIYNNDGTGRILQDPNINSGINGYINGYYNPKMYIKPNIDIILELVNFVYDSSENNIVSGQTYSLPKIYIETYDSNNTFDDIVKNENRVLDSYISLHYVKLRCVNTNHYYIQHNSIPYINFEVTNTITETISFEHFDFDLEAGSITSSISRLDQSLFLNETRIRSNNVVSSLAPLTIISSSQSPKIRFTIEDQYTDDPLLTYLFYFKKIEYYGGYLRTISTPYFSNLNNSISLNPLQTSFPFRAYIGSFVVTLNGKTHSLPIYTSVNELSKSDIDNLIFMISITGGLKTESQISNTIVNKFNVNTSTENNDKSSIIELFLQQQMKKNLSKFSSTVEKQRKSILGKSRIISTFYNTDEPNDNIPSLITTFKNSGSSLTTYRPMTFGHSINGPSEIVIDKDTDRIIRSHDKIFIINHTIRTFVDLTTGLDISFDIFINKRMNTTTQNDVDISINYYNEYKYPRREFDVTISGGKFEISYTSGSQYNVDVSGTTYVTYTGSALDENGNLNCNENEIYIFNQTDSTNLDSNGILHDALTVYPVDPSGNSMKYANVNCIPTLGGPLTKTRIFHCFKPKFFSEQMDTTKYYFGSIREALDISFGEWWMNDLHDGTNINIIVDIDDYESPTSFRFLKNHIRSIPLSKIKEFIDINGSSYTVDDISSITYNYSGDSIPISSSSSLYFHFDLSSEIISMSSDTTLDVGTFSHITTNHHHIGSSDISSIYRIESGIVYNFTMDKLASIVIDGSISNSDISINEIDYEQLYINATNTYVFKPSSFYLKSILFKRLSIYDVSNNSNTILNSSNISITNTNSIQFKKDIVIQGEFGSSFNSTNDWTYTSNSMGSYINIISTIPLGNDSGDYPGYKYSQGSITKTRDALEMKSYSSYNTKVINNQRFHPFKSTNSFNTFDSIQ